MRIGRQTYDYSSSSWGEGRQWSVKGRFDRSWLLYRCLFECPKVHLIVSGRSSRALRFQWSVSAELQVFIVLLVSECPKVHLTVSGVPLRAPRLQWCVSAVCRVFIVLLVWLSSPQCIWLCSEHLWPCKGAIIFFLFQLKVDSFIPLKGRSIVISEWIIVNFLGIMDASFVDLFYARRLWLYATWPPIF